MTDMIPEHLLRITILHMYVYSATELYFIDFS